MVRFSTLTVTQWTYDTPIEEVMHYLNDLIMQGKVTYIGISDAPAWIVSRANQYARDHALRQFVIVRVSTSLPRSCASTLLPPPSPTIYPR